MNSILEDLYYGRISPWERPRTKNSERSTIRRKIEKEKQYFAQKMSLDDCQRFEELESLYSQSSGFENVDAFSCGVKLGALLTCAVCELKPMYSEE